MTLPPHAEVRDCRLYRFWVRHPVTGERTLGYIGETYRQPLTRLLEHLMDQPWADTIIGWEVDDEVFAGKAAVLAAERFTIETELPLYNVDHNRANPRRIPPPLAMKQRRARDAAKAAQERWVHPDDRKPTGNRPAAAAPRGPPRQVTQVSKPWPRWRRHLVGWSVAWLVLTCAGWIVLAHVEGASVQDAGVMSAVLTSAVVGFLARWSWLGCPMTEKSWRRAAGRRKR